MNIYYAHNYSWVRDGKTGNIEFLTLSIVKWFEKEIGDNYKRAIICEEVYRENLI